MSEMYFHMRVMHSNDLPILAARFDRVSRKENEQALFDFMSARFRVNNICSQCVFES